MAPPMWIVGMLLTAALFVGSAAADDPVSPGRACDGIVDVNCDDANKAGEYYRHCLVYTLYLDLGHHQIEGISCEDNPYA